MHADPETPREPGRAAFPTTLWSRLSPGPEADEAQRREAFETLARVYARPIAAYVRARWARSDEEALDAVQDFFVFVMEGDLLARADPERGRFRGFVKTCLAHFLRDRERRARTDRRGGDRRSISLSTESGEALELPDTSGKSPEAALDDLWRQELLGGAARRLEAELAERGKERCFAIFQDYFLSGGGFDYAQVAVRHACTKADVSNELAYAKRRYRAHLRDGVLETVRGDDDLRAELDWLFDGEGVA